MGRTTKEFTYTDGSYFCNVCDSPHEGESLAEACFKHHEKQDFLTYGDVKGLTKLEIVLALEEVVLEHNLYQQAMDKLNERADENNKIPCELCTDTETEKSEIDGYFYCEPPCVEDDTITMHDED